MTPRRILGLVLVIIGIVALLWGGVFWKDRDTVFQAGPLEVATEENKGVSVPPLAAGACIVVGIVLLAVPLRRQT